MSIRKVKGKMRKYKALRRHRALRRYLPETKWLTGKNAYRMIRAYSTLFIKPDGGTGGAGIIRARRLRRGYELRRGLGRKRIPSSALLQAIRRYRTAGGAYIVQQGIPLARYKGALFDVRVYLQKPGHSWRVAGMIVRVAAPHRFVTNFHQGGRPAPLEKVMRSVFGNDRKAEHCIRMQKRVSLAAARKLDAKFLGLRELGMDLGVDDRGRIWIIEANTQPGHALFARLADKTMQRTILHNKHLIRKRYS